MINIFDKENLMKSEAEVKEIEDTKFKELDEKLDKLTPGEIFGETNTEKLAKMAGGKVLPPLEASMVDFPDPPKEVKKLGMADFFDKTEIPAQPDCLVEALRLLKKKIPTIPIGTDKRPLVKWDEFKKRLPTETEVLSWWSAHPTAQLGMPTGKLSGISVIDIEFEYGDPSDLNLPPTTITKTGGGGFHYWYKHRDGVANTAKIGGKPIDVRGEGGYIVIPPSKMAKGNYLFVTPWQDNLPAFPEEYTTKQVAIINGQEMIVRKERVETDYPGYGLGERDNRMTEYAGSLIGTVDSDQWPEVLEDLLDANQKNDPPMTDAQVRKIFDSVAKREIKTLEENPPVGMSTKAQEEKEAEYLAKEDDNPLTDFYTAADHDAENIGERIGGGLPKLDEYLGGGFQEGEIYIITGLSGHGKTTYMQNICAHFTGQKIHTIFLSYETGRPSLKEKFIALDADQKYLHTPEDKISSGEILFIKKKILEGKKFGVKAVFLDMLQHLHPSGAGLRDELRIRYVKLMIEIKKLAMEENVMIFITAHVAKTKEPMLGPVMQDIKESSSVYQDVDAVICVHREFTKIKKNIKSFVDPTKTIKVEEVKMSGRILIYTMKNRPTGTLETVYCDFDNNHYTEKIELKAPPEEMEKDRQAWTQK